MTFGSDESEQLNAMSEIDSESEYAPGQVRWYAVQVASGCEKRVKLNLDQRVQTLDVADRILKVEIPQTQAIKLRKDGSRQHGQEKVFPGYVLIQMKLNWNNELNQWDVDDEAWQVVKNTPHVINFVGAEQKRHSGRGRGHVKPLPLSPSEVDRIFRQTQQQETVVKVEMASGDHILVLSGPFKDFEGDVIEVSPERNKLKALLSIFGRDTPVELEFNQVEKQG
ncbi:MULTISPECIES: transcription termination/antitermination protein NusG [Arthrospira]|jgi:transcriptional antiterminator NusG|uniref:Transcription termination/antitermination protein NusG n=1 Tax=Limnospira platensis NIES-46 TaxID=1236695 RepID=A0A5M3T6J4_LIMPL|nr:MULTISPECIES: transcription termination/antitermination protein NusG [Arthrospira]AMW26871.1 antitermination protein NusG [Arthrospira platensis YZ]KDR57362.1 antitermination protein NusG [Arthrospira platensis str. Paraca]MBD2669358.1 transcription termination/antitermination protein NusG [Arthrospira platensis FACHB-439]MBD2709744.1 transcription termination/antitermination protein NusG [Arthrospira platensis FACHB-835]MDF2211745.1 transcription termination/antitermination protein NusG [A